MENKASSSETRSPITQRRRLSVPETVMRKHNLALERSSVSQSKHFSWDKEAESWSDPNLNRKKDSNIIRKSTLLRRLWSDNSKPKLYGSFHEWQQSNRKLSSTQSLNSNNSSPEHLPRRFDRSSPHRKFSSSPSKLSSKFTEDQNTALSPKRKLPVLQKTSRTSQSRETTIKYTGSSFTNMSDTNSDSAYSNSISHFTESASSRSNSKGIQSDENSNRCKESKRLVKESGAQTRDVSNLNVISNISLSQSTLDVIFKEVMKDVGRVPAGNININTAAVTSDQEPALNNDNSPRFFIDATSDVNFNTSGDVEKLIIGKVRTGSPYSKPAELNQPLVPRFSAFPRTSSMEVNTSEEDKEDSETLSFVDSLEDFTSPRTMSNSCTSFSDVAQLLPEGKNDESSRKSSTFFIPIQVKTDNADKSVSELLPNKVRERLNERQHQREEKLKQYRNSSQSTTSNVSIIKNTLNFSNHLPKKKVKPILPSIASLKKASIKEKKSEHQSRRKHAELTRSRNDGTFRAQAKDISAEPSKDALIIATGRREILQVTESAELSPDRSRKSKIPIPVCSCSSSRKVHFDKPSYLDFDNYASDPKVDQLIANILIDSLNHNTGIDRSNEGNSSNYPKDKSSSGNNGNTRPRHSLSDESTKQLIALKNNNLSNNNNALPELNGNSSKNNNSSIPKGWVTVYTVRKDLESPESTSDEGKKYLMATSGAADSVRERQYYEKIVPCDENCDYPKNSFIPSNRHEKATAETRLDMNYLNKFESARKSTKRDSQQEKTSLGEWSVTISGTNTYGQAAPDVEMRLKFPKKHRTNSYSSFEKENNQNSHCRFPKIDADATKLNCERQYQKEKSQNYDNLPKIKNTRRTRKREGSVLSMSSSVMIPRQTKTSTSRYHFSRPRERFSLPEVPSMLNERQCFDIMKQIPDILAVTGRSISPELRPMEER
uniref:Uncharacterized protein n=1 Tax=Dendroctonus ponderosae TaxID=77166 RepID=A0AAR5P1C0_DENPD